MPSGTCSIAAAARSLRRSLHNPHPESVEFDDEGIEAWTRSLPEDDAEALVDSSAGTAVRWVSGEGWVDAA